MNSTKEVGWGGKGRVEKRELRVERREGGGVQDYTLL